MRTKGVRHYGLRMDFVRTSLLERFPLVRSNLVRARTKTRIPRSRVHSKSDRALLRTGDPVRLHFMRTGSRSPARVSRQLHPRNVQRSAYANNRLRNIPALLLVIGLQ
jgi:hypothetical protein